MRNLKAIIAVLVIAMAQATAAVADSSAGQFVQRSLEAARFSDAAPFRLEGRFRLLGGSDPADEGSIVIHRLKPMHWVEQIEIGGYRRLRVSTGTQIRTEDSLPYQPLRVFDLELLLSLEERLAVFPTDQARVRTKKSRKVSSTCLKAKTDDRESLLCFDPATDTLLSERHRVHVVPGVSHRVEFEYADYRPFGGRPYPRHIRFREQGRETAQLFIDSLEEIPEADYPHYPSSGTVIRPAICEVQTAPEFLRHRGNFGPTSRDPGGKIMARMVIGRDGLVHDPRVLQSAGMMQRVRFETRLLEQIWKPGTCNGVPVDMVAVFGESTLGSTLDRP